MKNCCIFLFGLLFLASCKETKNDKLVTFLKETHISTADASVTILNPDYCGSCTQEVINWLIRHDQQKSPKLKYILKTAEIPEDLAQQLKGTHYKQVLVKGEKIERLGFGGAISINVTVKDDAIVSEKLVKDLPN